MLVADVSDEGSLLAMARSAAVVLNCVGPFRYWGEPVVAACVGAGTHYLDICGEPGTLSYLLLKPRDFVSLVSWNLPLLVAACELRSQPGVFSGRLQC